MTLECVVVCVNYSDFLCWTLPFNKQHFDRMVVVTSSADKKTQKLCEYWNVMCVVTDACYENEDVFNKGRMINEGLKHLSQKDWVLHLDADIYLPPTFGNILRGLKLDKQSIYHFDRLMCESFEDWIKFLQQPTLQHENHIWVHQHKEFKLGVRLCKLTYGGTLPIGYAQLWNQGYHNFEYPTEHTTAARGDVQFALKFDRDKRGFLPEIFGIHLETKIIGEGMGQNWDGRKTPFFGIINETEENRS